MNVNFVRDVIARECGYHLKQSFHGADKSETTGDGKSVKYIESTPSFNTLPVGIVLYGEDKGFWMRLTPPGAYHYWMPDSKYAWVLKQMGSEAGIEWMLGKSYCYAELGGPTQAALLAAQDLIQFLSVFTQLQRAVDGTVLEIE